MTANGRVLLPTLRKVQPSEALAYVESVLVDLHQGDSIETLVGSATGDSESYSVASSSMTLLWLTDALQRARRTQGTGTHALIASGQRKRSANA